MSGGQVLLFRAGGLRLGVFLSEVGRLIVEGPVAALPFSHPAMAGILVSDDDSLVPVFDLRGLVGKPASTEGLRQPNVALFPTARGPVGVRLEQVVGTVSKYDALANDVVDDLRGRIAPGLRTMITGAASVDGEPFYFFSPDAFLAGLGF